MTRITTFLDSPSNRTFVCAILSALPPLATILLDGNAKEIAVAATIGQVCFALLKLLQPDNTAQIAQVQAEKAVNNGPTNH
jgi:hypothetical protein